MKPVNDNYQPVDPISFGRVFYEGTYQGRIAYSDGFTMLMGGRQFYDHERIEVYGGSWDFDYIEKGFNFSQQKEILPVALMDFEELPVIIFDNAAMIQRKYFDGARALFSEVKFYQSSDFTSSMLDVKTIAPRKLQNTLVRVAMGGKTKGFITPCTKRLFGEELRALRVMAAGGGTK